MLNGDTKEKLLLAAAEARRHAYAPYSGNFKVGAAVLTEGGDIFSGCNVENASFGATVCAERVAIFKAVSEGHRTIRAVAVIAESAEPIPPCGMCLQVMSEFGRDVDVMLANTDGDVRTSTLREMLPTSFKFRHPGE